MRLLRATGVLVSLSSLQTVVNKFNLGLFYENTAVVLAASLVSFHARSCHFSFTEELEIGYENDFKNLIAIAGRSKAQRRELERRRVPSSGWGVCVH